MTAIRILAIALLCGVGALFAAERADAAARPVGPSPGLTEDVPGAPIAFTAQEGETDIARYYGRMHAIARGLVTPLLRAADIAPAQAACTSDRAPKLHALLIGAADPGPRGFRLNGPENDVALLADALVNGGAARDDVRVLTGADAGRKAMLDAIVGIAAGLQCDDKVFFYFGGHAFTPGDLGIDEAVRAELGIEATIGRAIAAALRGGSASDAVHRAAAALDWYLRADLLLMLNSGSATMSDLHIVTAADLSEMVTLFRNAGADVILSLDVRAASEARIMERQKAAVANVWSADILSGGHHGGAGAPFQPTPLAADPGELAVFYSTIGDTFSHEVRYEHDGRQVVFGVFTFRLGSALQAGTAPTVRQIRDSLAAIASDDTRSQAHRVEATNPDMALFAETGRRLPPSRAIRILSPAPKRGATPVEREEIEIRGRVDWSTPARIVLIQGQQATLDADGGFARTVRLLGGVNDIQVVALTADGRQHGETLSFYYDGDRKALEGEGRRYAVIVANQNYPDITGFSSLATPFADADAVAEVLTERYGFETEITLSGGRTFSLLLRDASGRDIMRALHNVTQVAGDKDTVLVYYAGHGIYESVTTTAFWVPFDAEQGVPSTYLSASSISEQLQRMLAGNVIIISDSCYSGALLRGGSGTPEMEAADEARTAALLRLAGRSSRVLISSGGTEPVEDLGGDGHSVFARALLTGLREMEHEAFTARELFDQYLLPMVIGRADQEPQYRPIEKSGHEGGDIVFVRMERDAPR